MASMTLALAFPLGLLYSLAMPAPALADRDDDYADGVEAYNRGNYRVANQYFLDAMKEGNSNAIVMLYLAHSYAAQGQYKLALPVYRNIRDSFRGTAEAAQAASCVLRLENPATFAAQKGQSQTATFYNRVKPLAAKKGHAAVSKATIAAVQKAITGMPRAIYQILDTAQVTVCVAPSAQDKLAANSKLQEAAILNGKEITVFENLMVPGKGTKGSTAKPFPPAEIKEAFLKQVGNAIEQCSGGLARDPDFHAAYKLDMRDLPPDAEETMPFLAPPANLAEQEVCAYIIDGIAGGSSQLATAVSKNFPKTKAWLINKLRLQN
jgi:tetratricopeptide (TPR) repeat protein